MVLVSPGTRRSAAFSFTPRMAVDSAAAMRALVLEGIGVATLPAVTVRTDIAKGRLVEPLPAWPPASVGVYAVWPHNAQRAGLTQRFVDFIAERVATLLRAGDLS